VTGDHENAGFRRLFGGDELTVGTGFPLTGDAESCPAVDREMELVDRAESLGYAGLWARDVPLYWPKFGDAGQTFDPWTWLSHAAAHSDDIALGTASVVLPLRHPLHVAKQAASLDQLSDGRFVMGVATGDRDPEFPAFDVDHDDRGALFREHVHALRACWREEFPEIEGTWGRLEGELDVVPDPTTGTVPLLPTGNARQSVDWLGEHGDGWLFYHLPMDTLESYLDDWRGAAGGKPYAMAMQVALAGDPTADPEPVHQGYRAGSEWFVEYLRELEDVGVDHLVVSTPGEEPERELTAFAEQVIERV
jgi:luciferase-type oxidoreductase